MGGGGWGAKSLIGNFLCNEFQQNGSHFYIMADANFLFPSTLKKKQKPKLWEVCNWKFSVQQVSTKWQPLFHFFITAEVKFLFQLTLKNAETQTLGGVLIGNFLCNKFPKKGSHFFIMANLVQFSKFKCDELSALKHSCVVPFTILGSVFNIQA